MVGCDFLTESTEEDKRFPARVVKAIYHHQHKAINDPLHWKFLCSVNDGQYEEVMSYNNIIRYIEEQGNSNGIWKFKRIASHEGPLKPGDNKYMGSKFNLIIE